MIIYFICDQSIWKYFEDYIESLVHVLTQKNQLVQVLTLNAVSIRKWFHDQQLIHGNKNKYVFIQSDYDVVYNPGIDVYVVNTEQMTRIKYRTAMTRLLDKGYKIIEYSEENVCLLCEHKYPEKQITFIPYQVNPKELTAVVPKTNGSCFIGCLSPRRQRILQKIGNVNIVKGWGAQRDIHLFTHKIMVNIHFNEDYRINEQLRINRCIFNRIIVVSERSVHDELLYLNKYIVFCDYDKIPDTVTNIMNNYEYYLEKIFKDFELDVISRQLSSHCCI
jgi:hypothetical protein